MMDDVADNHPDVWMKCTDGSGDTDGFSRGTVRAALLIHFT